MNMEPTDRLSQLNVHLGDEYNGLDVFVVGGAVRALYTGNPVSDIDLMVQGVTEKQMLDREFEKIDAASFPVFHDHDKREVALAREERSTGPEHTDFEVYTHPDLTIENDLNRRDFTCNAMAVALTDTPQAAPGELVDPHGGVSDIERGVIQPVFERTFVEDPLRLLRLARFAGRLEFGIEEETMKSAQRFSSAVERLPAERIGEEILKAMRQAQWPSTFFNVCSQAGILEYILPELDALHDVPAGPEEHHREANAYVHSMLVADEASKLRSDDGTFLLAAALHDIGKGATARESLPSHPRHHMLGADMVPDIQERLALSNAVANSLESAIRFHMRFHKLDELRPATLIETVNRISEFDPHEEMIDLAVADERGRRPRGEYDRERAESIIHATFDAMNAIYGRDIVERWPDKEGEEIGELLLQERIKELKSNLADIDE